MANRFLKSFRIMEVAADYKHMFDISGTAPDVDDLCGKAAIRKGHDSTTARTQDAAHLLEHLQRLSEIVDRDNVGNDIEGVVFEWEGRVYIQIANDATRGQGIGVELLLVHADNGERFGRVVVRDVRNPAGAEVQNVGIGLECFCVEAG